MKDCFIICPIGDEGSEIRKRSDRLLKHVLSPVLAENGYCALRADQIPKVGLITSQVINLIIESPLVIADLTGANPNVYYELAIRHASQKPYIQLIGKGEKIPFDISAVRTITVDLADLDDVEEAKKKISQQIAEFNKGHRPESPISIAYKVKLLQDDDVFAEQLADKISSFGSGFDCYGCDPVDSYDSKLITEIHNKVACFRDFGCVDLEDLDKKLNLILSKLDKIG
jgi:hypothetical protein